MFAHRAGRKQHELVEIVRGLRRAARPILLEVVENCLASVMAAGRFVVLLGKEALGGAALVGAHGSPFFVKHGLFLFDGFRCFLDGDFLLLFLVEVFRSLHLRDAVLLDPVGGVLDGLALPEALQFRLLFVVGVTADGAALKSLKLVPLVSDLLAAGPPLLEVVENGLAGMEGALGTIVGVVRVGLAAPLPFTLLLNFLNHLK